MSYALHFIILHLLFCIYSLSGIFSKLASFEDAFSCYYIVLYFFIVGILFIYSIGWQQIIKKLPLSVAYSNKAIIVIWSMIWGYIFFGECVHVKNIIAILLIVTGIIIFFYQIEK